MQDSAYGSSHGAFLQKPAEQDAVPTVRAKSCKFSTDFGPRDVADEIAYDVDQLHDELPQPYRFVNQLIKQLVSDALDKTFVDASATSLEEGRLDWRLPEAEQKVELPSSSGSTSLDELRLELRYYRAGASRSSQHAPAERDGRDEKECRKGALTILSPAVTPSALLNLPLLTSVALL